jgi:hypothetical protein
MDYNICYLKDSVIETELGVSSERVEEIFNAVQTAKCRDENEVLMCIKGETVVVKYYAKIEKKV